MYCAGLGLRLLGSFEDHAGFDGVMLGNPEGDYHFEFTHCRFHPITASATVEDLLVFYLPDTTEWQQLCTSMTAAGFQEADSFNRYWQLRGRTFQDFDGYRIVLQNAEWKNSEMT
jgi:hypothetical protein